MTRPNQPDPQDDLRRAAARARRAALKDYPKGSTVTWANRPRRINTGVVRHARHDDVTGEVVLVVDCDGVGGCVAVVPLRWLVTHEDLTGGQAAESYRDAN